MDKIHYALTHLELILNGLTRGIDFSILDSGHGEQAGAPVCFSRQPMLSGSSCQATHSPSIHSGFPPSPEDTHRHEAGRDEPWTPSA